MNNFKQPMTEDERQKLASCLDDDLDEFINNLQKTPYKDGWKEETWREVILKSIIFIFHIFTTESL